MYVFLPPPRKCHPVQPAPPLLPCNITAYFVTHLTSELNPLPTDLLKQFLPELLPYVADMCNASLQHGCCSLSQRHAIIMPHLKKSGLDALDAKDN